MVPWTVFADLERLRHRARELAASRAVAAVVSDSTDVIRRRNTEDMAAVSRLITGAAHCVPCITLITNLDARRVYAALEQLKATAPVLLVHDRCTRCRRTTMAHLMGPRP
jgi:hypothetical protein